jgi:hypothetical protein
MSHTLQTNKKRKPEDLLTSGTETDMESGSVMHKYAARRPLASRPTPRKRPLTSQGSSKERRGLAVQPTAKKPRGAVAAEPASKSQWRDVMSKLSDNLDDQQDSSMTNLIQTAATKAASLCQTSQPQSAVHSAPLLSRAWTLAQEHPACRITCAKHLRFVICSFQILHSTLISHCLSIF